MLANAYTLILFHFFQGGPGCGSTFGDFYELGPQLVTGLALQPNPGAWNRRFGLLVLDQPIGTGFSLVGSDSIPTDEMQMATHLYLALVSFFEQHRSLQQRPLIIAGEIPSPPMLSTNNSICSASHIFTNSCTAAVADL